MGSRLGGLRGDENGCGVWGEGECIEDGVDGLQGILTGVWGELDQGLGDVGDVGVGEVGGCGDFASGGEDVAEGDAEGAGDGAVEVEARVPITR